MSTPVLIVGAGAAVLLLYMFSSEGENETPAPPATTAKVAYRGYEDYKLNLQNPLWRNGHQPTMEDVVSVSPGNWGLPQMEVGSTGTNVLVSRLPPRL